VSWHCRRCDAPFESDADEPRCPTCLRKSSVIDTALPQDIDASTSPPIAVYRYAGLGSAMVIGVLAGGVITAVGVVSLAVGIVSFLSIGLTLFGITMLAGCGELARRWLRDPPCLRIYADKLIVPVGVARDPVSVPFNCIARLGYPINLGSSAGRVVVLELTDSERVIIDLGDYPEAADGVYRTLVSIHDEWLRGRG
jgi:hypothetical protein